MVMHYLIQQNDIYIERVDEFEARLDKLFDLMKRIQYNIDELTSTVHTLRTTDAEDTKLKEAFNAKRQGHL